MLSVSRALVTGWILEQVLLMVVLRIVPLLRRLDGRDDFLASTVKVLALHVLRDLFSDTLLLGCMIEDR